MRVAEGDLVRIANLPSGHDRKKRGKDREIKRERDTDTDCR